MTQQGRALSIVDGRDALPSIVRVRNSLWSSFKLAVMYGSEFKLLLVPLDPITRSSDSDSLGVDQYVMY